MSEAVEMTREQFLTIIDDTFDDLLRVEYTSIDGTGRRTFEVIEKNDIHMPDIIEVMVSNMKYAEDCEDEGFECYIDIFAEIKEVPVWLMQVAPADRGLLEVRV